MAVYGQVSCICLHTNDRLESKDRTFRVQVKKDIYVKMSDLLKMLWTCNQKSYLVLQFSLISKRCST